MEIERYAAIWIRPGRRPCEPVNTVKGFHR